MRQSIALSIRNSSLLQKLGVSRVVGRAVGVTLSKTFVQFRGRSSVPSQSLTATSIHQIPTIPNVYQTTQKPTQTHTDSETILQYWRQSDASYRLDTLSFIVRQVTFTLLF